MKHYLKYKREEVKDSEVSFESKRTKATWRWYDLDQAALKRTGKQTPFTWGLLTEGKGERTFISALHLQEQ